MTPTVREYPKINVAGFHFFDRLRIIFWCAASDARTHESWPLRIDAEAAAHEHTDLTRQP